MRSTPRHRERWNGPAGALGVAFDAPSQAPRLIALIAHPHPLQGGTAEHKVPAFLARRLAAEGALAVRPSFRGTGESEGAHDEGIGETEDLVFVARRLRELQPGVPLALIGFSFGAWVQIRVAQALADAGEAAAGLVLAGMGIGRVEGSRDYEAGPVPADTLVIHGELDERVPLANVFDWARPQNLPVTVIPGTDHFFGGRLPLLARVVGEHLKRSTG